MRALRPDVGIVHAQQADEAGNVQIWGITGVQKEAVLASRRSLVTVEEIVPRLIQRPGGIVLPSQVITAVALAPGGAHPSYAHGYYDRDNAFYVAWDAISRDREQLRRLDAASRARDARQPGVPAQPGRRRGAGRVSERATRGVHRRRDDVGGRRAAPARRRRLLRRHRAAEPRRQPRPLDARAEAAC